MSLHRSPKLVLIAFSLLLGACSFQFQAGTSAGTRNQRQAARPKAGATTPKTQSTAPTTATTTKTPTTPTVQAPMITGRNAFGNGTLGAFRGKAYVIPNTTTKMPDLSTLVPFAGLLTDSFIVQTQEFTEGFPGVLKQDEWFAIRYDGTFDITKEATYTLKLVSDDGAILYVDGEKLVDNDGIHTAKAVQAAKVLKVGKHSLRLDYFQGARGSVALNLSIVEGTNTEQMRPLVGIR